MIAPLVLYLYLITEHHTVFRATSEAPDKDSSDNNRTLISKTDFSQITPEVKAAVSTEKYAEIFTSELQTSNSYQELFKLNSTSEENPDGDETVFMKTIKVIPRSMIGYYQTNFSHSTVVLEGKMRKVFLKDKS